MFELKSGMVVEVKKYSVTTYGVVVGIGENLFFQYFEGGFDHARLDLCGTKVLKVFEIDGMEQGFTINKRWQDDRIKLNDMHLHGKVVWKRHNYYTLKQASQTGKRFRHKSCEFWCSEPEVALRNACSKTKQDMFTILNKKEFVLEEI